VHSLQGVDHRWVRSSRHHRHEVNVALVGTEVAQRDGADQVETLDQTWRLGVYCGQIAPNDPVNCGVQFWWDGTALGIAVQRRALQDTQRCSVSLSYHGAIFSILVLAPYC